MKKIAIFCVSYHSDEELEQYLSSIKMAQEKARGQVELEVHVAKNTDEDNPGYFGAITRLMLANNVDVYSYDYVIISNVDLKVEEDFFQKLAAYECGEDTGWIAPRIWSELEGRDRNPARVKRPSRRRMQILRAFYQYPILDTIYHYTAYHRKKYHAKAQAGPIYAGHGSLIILTHAFFLQYGGINYPKFLFCEELYLAELCRVADLKVVYEPSIRVNDKEHVSVGRMSHRDYCRYNLDSMNFMIRFYF